MDARRAADDLTWIRDVLARSQQTIDPHAGHFLWWGAIVLLWYPLSNVFQLRGLMGAMVATGVTALVLGIVGSIVLEWRLHRNPRLPEGEHTFVNRQVSLAVQASIGAGIVLSAVAPSTGFVAGPAVPIVWALVYAVMACMLGIVYDRSFLVSAACIFVAACVAMGFVDYAGWIVGPAMGIGLIVPAVLAERRVARLRAERAADASA